MLGQSKGMPWAILYYAGIHSTTDWMWLSSSNHNKLYGHLGKFRNGRKMLDLVSAIVYFVPINNGEEGEWSG